jgi:hypothetical protein
LVISRKESHQAVRRSRQFNLPPADAPKKGTPFDLADRYHLDHSVLIYWLKKYERGELAEDDHLEDQVHEYEAQVAALERKVGQLTMELDALKRGAARYPADAKRALIAYLRTVEPERVGEPKEPRLAPPPRQTLGPRALQELDDLRQQLAELLARQRYEFDQDFCGDNMLGPVSGGPGLFRVNHDRFQQKTLRVLGEHPTNAPERVLSFVRNLPDFLRRHAQLVRRFNAQNFALENIRSQANSIREELERRGLMDLSDADFLRLVALYLAASWQPVLPGTGPFVEVAGSRPNPLSSDR